MKGILLASAILFAAVNVFAQQDVNPGRPIAVSVAKAYVPQCFDSNDRTQVVVEGYFPNTCYRVGPNRAFKNDKGEIEITQTAYVYKGVCLMMIVPYQQTINVGILERSGDYKIVDTLSKKSLGTMPVATSKTTGPDDFVYASISDAYVSYVETDERVVVIHGEVPGSCWEVSDKRVFRDGNDVLTVLPIMTQTSDDNCTEIPVPFVTTVKMPELSQGRYLLQVRSLSGQSVNKLFDVQ